MKLTRSFFLPAWLALVLATPAAGAAEGEPVADPIAAKREQASAVRQRAKALRQEAEAAFQRESAECRQTVLVNNCLSSAGNRRLESIEQARALENESGLLERDVRRAELAERRAERARRLAERKAPTTVSVDGAPSATLPAGKAGSAVRPGGEKRD